MDTGFDLDYKCLNEFPSLSNIDYHVLFKERICYFYLNLTRKSSHKNVLELSKQLTDSLRLLKTCIQKSQDEYLPYLNLFYRMLGQTRDIIYGKGEHEISYMMILVFYEVFPVLAIYAVYRYVQPIDGQDVPYGSWRDIKYLCEYIREYSSKGDDHELIKICIELINSQLFTDLETWRFSIHPRSRKHISNVAKWIPRENKHFTWLFERLAIHWTEKHLPYIFETLTKPDSVIKAVMKAKQIYRKKISLLNKALDTTEIKQCSQKILEIEPKHVAWHTFMKQPKLVFGSDVIYRECSQKMRDHMIKNIKTNTHHYYSNYYHVSFFVKQALFIISDKNEDKKVGKDILNKLWSKFSRTVKGDGLGNVLPTMDVSFYMQAMDSEEFYTAIGFSILIAERSKFGKRILAVDYQSTWINLDGCEDFVSMIENIHQTMLSRSNTASNIDNAIELFVYSLLQSKSTRRFIENMSIVLFSDFSSLLSIDSCKEKFIKFCSHCPNIICWNMAKHKLVEPFYKTDDTIVIMSGLSNGCFNSFTNMLKKINIDKTLPSVFDNVSMVLNNGRYDILESYLQHCIQV
jgi:hypothetical protein